MFSFEDTRYNRQLQMPEWGPERQDRLNKGRVVCIGAGGVKSVLLQSLVAAGVGHLTIIENDTVEVSNLNRQLLYRTSDIGRSKVSAAVQTLHELNPQVQITGINEKVTAETIEGLCSGYDIVIEGGDSPAGRNLVNEFCLRSSTPLVHASAQFNYGYVFSVVPERKSACFACLFPDDHTRSEHTGPVPVSVLATSLAGALGAAEVIKYLVGYPEYMYLSRRLCFSSLLMSGEFHVEEVPRRPECPVCTKFYR